jgi:hypothetical protein
MTVTIDDRWAGWVMYGGTDYGVLTLMAIRYYK